MSDNLVLVGAVMGAFGVKGEVRVKSFTADPEAIATYGPLLDAEGRTLLTPKTIRVLNDSVALTAPEIKTREEAQALRNTPLHVPRGKLPPADDEEFYYIDLIGCRVETEGGELLGFVHAVQNFGADDVLELKRPGEPNLFLPFTKAVVSTIDLKAKRLIAIPLDITDQSD